MIQHLLNANNDITTISFDGKYPEEMSEQDLSITATEQQFRILHQFQAQFLLDSNGKIDNSTVKKLFNNASNGPTKLNLAVDVGEFGIVNLPVPLPGSSDVTVPLSLPPVPVKHPITEEASEPSPHNEEVNIASDGLSVSGYASARIGLKGQAGSYRLFGKDAPWIFSEIIIKIGSDRDVRIEVETSVTTVWKEDNIEADPDGGGTVSRSSNAPATTPGICPFNNLNIYDYRPSDLDAPSSEYIFSRRGLLEMEGNVECFVESSSGAWPEPPTKPITK